MRDPARIDRLIEKLRATWHAHPDQRLGQIVDNLAGDDDVPTFSVEDDVLEKNLDAVAVGGFAALYGKRAYPPWA